MPRSALLIIDFVNEFAFSGGKALARRALPAAKATASLRDGLEKDTAVIYANDNFGKWRSDFREVVKRCGRPESAGWEVVQTIRPRTEDHFVLKPRHSAFYNTPLESLLGYLRVRKLILTGVAVDLCVLFTANDAHLREFELWIPADCIAGANRAVEADSLRYFSRSLHADIRPARRS